WGGEEEDSGVTTSSGPMISVVIPSFQQGRFLRDALDSILAQDYDRFEIIVMDGGSTDETRQVLEEYSDSLAYWVSAPDGGQADALRRGFELAKGDIFAWLNCDDMYLPGAFSAASHEFATRPELGMVYGDYILMRENGE